MSFEAIRQIVEGRMAAWDGVPVAFDGVPSGPAVQSAIDAKESWVRLTINHGNSTTAGVDSKPRARNTGLIMVQVFTPERSGSRPAALLADSLAEHLQYYQSGPLETLAASAERVGPGDGWYQVNVSCPFRYR